MTESEKHSARLAAQILGLTSPVYNTSLPTIDDYQNELEHLEKLANGWVGSNAAEYSLSLRESADKDRVPAHGTS